MRISTWLSAAVLVGCIPTARGSAQSPVSISIGASLGIERAVVVYRRNNEYFLPPLERAWIGVDKRYDYKHQPNGADYNRGRGRGMGNGMGNGRGNGKP